MTFQKKRNSIVFQTIKSDSGLKELQIHINEIFDKTLFKKYGLSFKEEEITDKQFFVFDGDQKVGIFVYSTEVGTTQATIDLIGVLPELRDKNYGSSILYQGLKMIQQLDPTIKEVFVEILANDIRLSNFYIKNRFLIDKIEFYAFNKKGKLITKGKLMDLNTILTNTDISHLMVWNFLKIEI